MWDDKKREFKRVDVEEMKFAKTPIFFVGQEFTLNGMIFSIVAIKKRKIVCKALRKAETSGGAIEAKEIIDKEVYNACGNLARLNAKDFVFAGDIEGVDASTEAEPKRMGVVPVVSIPKTTPSAGISGAIKTVWSAEVYNLKELVMAIAKDRASIGLIEPNMVALNGLARSLKKNMSIPGVRAISKKV